MPGKGAVCWPIQRITKRWLSQGNSMKSMGTPFVQRHLISDIMNKILVRNCFLHLISQMRTFHVGYYKYSRLWQENILTCDITNECIWYLISQIRVHVFYREVFLHMISQMITFDIWYHKQVSLLQGNIFTSDITNEHIWYLISETRLL